MLACAKFSSEITGLQEKTASIANFEMKIIFLGYQWTFQELPEHQEMLQTSWPDKEL